MQAFEEEARGVCRELAMEMIAHLPHEVVSVLDEVAGLVVEKNRAYGNSALDPVRVFSKADAAEQIRIRLDDKLSRLARGDHAGEDVERDLMGYLVLLRIANDPGALGRVLAEKRKNESGSTRVRSVHGPLVGDGPEGGQE